jgi:hypothetical protein
VSRSDIVVFLARRFSHVREAGANTGARVEAIQKWCGGKAGESWCCYFATMVLDLAFDGKSPIPREGVCQDVYALAKKNGWVRNRGEVGDLFLYVDGNDHAHHIGIITFIMAARTPNPFYSGIAGNTSEDGQSTNGTGVFEHAVSPHVFVHYPR